MKFISGLVSISFRPEKAETLIDECRKHRLEAIEWGSDVHVPFGNVAEAERIKKATSEAGILMPEYGAYIELGISPQEDMEKTCLSALALGTPVVRIWAYNSQRNCVSDDEYEKAVSDARRLCDAFPQLRFCLECHINSLTQDYRDALQLIEDVERDNFAMFWQPNQLYSHDYNKRALRALLPCVYAVHVFSWEMVDGQLEQYPLVKKEKQWLEYLDILKDSPRETLPLMIEFVYDNRLQTLGPTADTLNGWIAKYN